MENNVMVPTQRDTVRFLYSNQRAAYLVYMFASYLVCISEYLMSWLITLSPCMLIIFVFPDPLSFFPWFHLSFTAIFGFYFILRVKICFTDFAAYVRRWFRGLRSCLVPTDNARRIFSRQQIPYA